MVGILITFIGLIGLVISAKMLKFFLNDEERRNYESIFEMIIGKGIFNPFGSGVVTACFILLLVGIGIIVQSICN